VNNNSTLGSAIKATSSSLSAVNAYLQEPSAGADTKELDDQEVRVTIFVAFASFCTYMFSYGFQRPWVVAVYCGAGNDDDSCDTLIGMDVKPVLAIALNISYLFGKFTAIYAVSSLQESQRMRWMILIPCTSLVFWGLLSIASVGSDYLWFAPFMIMGAIFPMTQLWSLIYRYLEGRRYAEVLAACLSASYVAGGGVMKVLGAWILDLGVDDYQMPVVCGAICLVPYIVFCLLLGTTPHPTINEQGTQGTRLPAGYKEQVAFLYEYWPGILMLSVSFALLSGLRSFRDIFQADIWAEKFDDDDPVVFLLTEIPAALAVMGILMLLNVFQDNQTAVFALHVTFLVGNVILFLCMVPDDTLLTPPPRAPIQKNHILPYSNKINSKLVYFHPNYSLLRSLRPF
jgi:hypothetical protein